MEEIVEEVEEKQDSGSVLTGRVVDDDVEEVTGIDAVDMAIDEYEINVFWVGIVLAPCCIVVASWIFWSKSR